MPLYGNLGWVYKLRKDYRSSDCTSFDVCEIDPCGFLRQFPGDSGTSSDGWGYG